MARDVRRRLLPLVVLALVPASVSLVSAQEDLPAAPAAFLLPETRSAGASVAIGPDGTVHMVAASYNAGDEDFVTYAACRADCTVTENWTRVTIPLPGAITAEIAVTPRGAPRLLINAAAADNSGGRDFLYAECGGSGLWGPRGVPAECLDPAGWSIGKVARNFESSMGDFFELLLPKRNFALDPNGNPRFIYTDSNYLIEPDHYGAFFMSCDRDCTVEANWTETDIARHIGYQTEQFTRPALAIGPTGSAHVLAWVYAFAEDGTDLPDDLYYYECAAACDVQANWSRVSVVNAGSGSYPSPTWDLTLDPAGRPRAAVFIGGGATQDDLDYSLVYLWCNSSCTSDTGWAGSVAFDGGFGESPALGFDAAGLPRIAFLSPDALPVLATCAGACESDQPQWNGFVFEAEADMAADRPTAIPFTCDGELWNALSPAIALAPDGRAFVAYDVTVQARCLYQDFGDPQITFEFHEIWRGARVAELAP